MLCLHTKASLQSDVQPFHAVYVQPSTKPSTATNHSSTADVHCTKLAFNSESNGALETYTHYCTSFTLAHGLAQFLPWRNLIAIKHQAPRKRGHESADLIDRDRITARSQSAVSAIVLHQVKFSKRIKTTSHKPHNTFFRSVFIGNTISIRGCTDNALTEDTGVFYTRSGSKQVVEKERVLCVVRRLSLLHNDIHQKPEIHGYSQTHHLNILVQLTKWWVLKSTEKSDHELRSVRICK